MIPYEVELSPSATRASRKLPTADGARIRRSLRRLASDVSRPGRIGGKGVKTIQGTRDPFHRLRVGDYRVMYDVIPEDRVVLVLGIVHRRELEGWLRHR